MKESNKYINLLLTTLVAILVGAVFMWALGYNPLDAYIQLFKGALTGNLGLGTTIQRFVPLLLTAIAFSFSSKVNCFNAGIEGELYLGAITAAGIGYNFTNLPGPIHILLCFALAAIVGALWAYIPAILKVQWGVNEVCVTILLTYVAKFFTSYLVNGPMSAKSGTPQTPYVARNVRLAQIFKPSQANVGVFVAIGLVIFLFWFLSQTAEGYKIKTVGLNPSHAEYVGINPKKIIVKAMMISGAIGGIAGCIEVLGVYGYFLDNFSLNLAGDGMMIALIVKNDMKMIPFMALFIAILRSGSLGMERYAGVPRSIVDAITAIFVVFATMDALYTLLKRHKQKQIAQTAQAN
jgi:simple sugar transport system permease protein